ncbi:mitochondrial thiosulfate sulfurtransferase/rhodanese-like domain Rdl2 [Schizosaccharomyces osmophilus]|uniref:Mitochondrial thiosulfate sulfurtransferase/rhodanese-like domain Rdl2 n=1 Tax=Schizosaccharomyces osmophilus TaxID=2545709 RepID=A0AAF0AWI3_9SCHI|nr:mitochondrial thiosulfate sulfurtransferase/rhodanese-like domain Rdl2 [Schizosaccharomyces osmophilus]WBW74746.1 mitochondrial thiosulfate sulfurtransferase/rhodanese-like domain Rdl2 [Schizosaccharomyces osmophilus]
MFLRTFRRMPAMLASRPFQTASFQWKVSIYDFKKVQELSKRAQAESKNPILIDVREPGEFEAGSINTAVNLPVGKLEDALKLGDKEFVDTYGFHKPSITDSVVVYCRSGKRSTAASKILSEKGYDHIGNYTGSWLDWSAKSEN